MQPRAAFAAGLSGHDVSSRAVGEALSEILAAGATDADLTVVAVTAGHAGALEDITATVAAALGTTTAVGLVVAAVALGGGRPDAGLAVWAGPTGPVEVVAGPDPAAGVELHGSARFVLPARGPVLVARSSGAGPPQVGPWRSGVTLRLAGHWSTRALVAVRDIGPPLRVTDASGREVATLDDIPAIERITALAHRHVATQELAAIGPRLCLRLPGGPPQRLAGFERTSGALVLAQEPAPAPGSRVRLCVPDDAAPQDEVAALTDRLHQRVGHGGGGALVVLPGDRPSAGRSQATEPALPTLVVRAAPVPGPRRAPGSADGDGPTVALFPSPDTAD